MPSEFIEPLVTLRIARKHVVEVAWSLDGTMLAASYKDKVVRVWRQSGGDWQLYREFVGHTSWVHGVAWHPDGSKLASAAEDGRIRIWGIAEDRELYKLDCKTGVCLGDNRELSSMGGPVTAVSWSFDGLHLAAAGSSGNAMFRTTDMSLQKFEPVSTTALAFHHRKDLLIWARTGGLSAQGSGLTQNFAGDYSSVAWGGRDMQFAAGTPKGEVHVFDCLRLDQRVLQGHRQGVSTLSFSANGLLLASGAPSEPVRLWRTDRWELAAIAPGRTPRYFPFGLQFHPKQPLLAHVTEEGSAIALSVIHFRSLEALLPAEKPVHYSNAKVILLGDTGVGKTALGLVLSDQVFRPTESTHRRNVWRFDEGTHTLTDGREERRETILWDLAGQTTHRLVHQLSLNQAAVALVLFDARNDSNPLSGVHHWSRALRQAQAMNGDVPIKKFLVSSRMDRGGSAISDDAIQNACAALGFEQYFKTSAKTGDGIELLKGAIRGAIDWDAMPKTTSNELFEQMRQFLFKQKEQGRLLVRLDELLRDFIDETKGVDHDTQDLEKQFLTYVGLMESGGLLRPLNFGGFVLLQPELLDAYAAAIINAAREAPHGFGSILEDRVRRGDFFIPAEDRPKDKEQEEILLLATIQELLRHEIALLEASNEGPILVFPSQFTREWPEAPAPQGKTIAIHFQGPVMNLYSTLAVRLARSELFTQREFWKNAVLYNAKFGGVCGLFLSEPEEGRATVSIFFEGVSAETRFHFENYVETHLKRRAIPGSVLAERFYICAKCETEVTPTQAKRRLERGFDWLRCGVCEERISLTTPAAGRSAVVAIDRAADRKRDQAEAKSIVMAKRASGDFDVFLCHNSKDKAEVRRIGELLMEHRLLPWLDVWQLQPGMPWQPEIEKQIDSIKAAAVFVGNSGFGPWEDEEARAFLSRFKKRNCPVIPVILTDAEGDIQFPAFLDERTRVDFRKSDPDPISHLVFGITGKNPVFGLDEER